MFRLLITSKFLGKFVGIRLSPGRTTTCYSQFLILMAMFFIGVGVTSGLM